MSKIQPFTESPRRTSHVQVRLTAAEREILRDLAARAGVYQSVYLRRLIAEQLRAEAEHVEQSESATAA